MSTYVDDVLIKDEVVMYRGHLTWWAFFWWILFGVLLRRASRAVRMMLSLKSWQRQDLDSSRGLFFSLRTNPPAMSRAAAVAGLREA